MTQAIPTVCEYIEDREKSKGRGEGRGGLKTVIEEEEEEKIMNSE
jgi:hypothetical protein